MGKDEDYEEWIDMIAKDHESWNFDAIAMNHKVIEHQLELDADEDDENADY